MRSHSREGPAGEFLLHHTILEATTDATSLAQVETREGNYPLDRWIAGLR